MNEPGTPKIQLKWLAPRSDDAEKYAIYATKEIEALVKVAKAAREWSETTQICGAKSFALKEALDQLEKE